MDELKIIPKNAIFIITAGAYEDYRVLTVCRALTEINPNIIQEEYLKEHPKERREYEFDTGRAISWMMDKKKYAKKIASFVLDLGAYSIAEFSVSRLDALARGIF